jgi:hypothetical protein
MIYTGSYTKHFPQGTVVNTDYIICALKKFLKASAKRYGALAVDVLVGQGPHFPESTAVPGQKVMPLLPLPHSVDLTLVDYFLFPALKRELAGLTLEEFHEVRGGGGGHQESD